MIATRLETVRDRLRAIGLRTAYGLGMLLAFAIGSIGAFLLFDWPPLLKQIVLAYLLVFLIVRLVLVLGRILLAPGAERFRVIPDGDGERPVLVRLDGDPGRLVLFREDHPRPAGGAGHEPTRRLPGRARLRRACWSGSPCTWCGGIRRGKAAEPASREHRLGAWLLSLYVVVVWLLLFTGSATPFYVGVILLLLPIALRCANLAVAHVLRPAEGAAADAAVPSLTAVTVERGLRAALLIGGAYLIAWLLGLDFAAMTTSDTMATRLLRGAINAVVIVLLADFAWHLARAWIDCKLVRGQRRAARRTPKRRAGGRACARFCRSSGTSCSSSSS